MKTKVYFENLNGVRFIAAYMVIVHHMVFFKSLLKIKNDHVEIYGPMGGLGVVLFFVLSGFLISFLLFKEQEVTQKIDLKAFYMRRILRIWPLYFLIIILALFILPHLSILTIPTFEKEGIWQNLSYKLLLFVFFLPNLVLVKFPPFIPYVGQAWSIGAEEQFYLIWPVLVRNTKNKYVMIFAVTLVYLAVALLTPLIFKGTYAAVFLDFWAHMPIDCMAIGGFFALVLYSDDTFARSVKKIIFNRLLQWAVFAITVYLILIHPIRIPYIRYEIFAVLFGTLIVNLAGNNKRIFSLEYKWLSYLGKISYGLYMYHSVVIVLVIRLLLHYGIFNNYLLTVLVTIFTCLLAALSYEFFEKWFLKKKINFSRVISG